MASKPSDTSHTTIGVPFLMIYHLIQILIDLSIWLAMTRLLGLTEDKGAAPRVSELSERLVGPTLCFRRYSATRR